MKNHTEQHEAATAAVVTGPRGSQPIRIMGFVDGDVIPPACYDEPYRLEPAKNDAKAYEVLRDVMQRTRKVGLASVVIRKKRALAAVIPIGRTLVLNVLRLASGLVPNRKRRESAVRLVAQPTLVRRLPADISSARRSAASETVRPLVRPSASRKAGEVIDLAVRRSSKRPQTRAAKPVRRGGTVATLHPLRRKSGRTAIEPQLA